MKKKTFPELVESAKQHINDLIIHLNECLEDLKKPKMKPDWIEPILEYFDYTAECGDKMQKLADIFNKMNIIIIARQQQDADEYVEEEIDDEADELIQLIQNLDNK